MMNSAHDDSSQHGALSTYIGYITGPAADMPPGVRVAEPPPNTRQYQRGSLYAIVDLGLETAQRAAATERILNILQQTYYSARGSQSQVMAEAMEKARQALQEMSNATVGGLRGGLLCAALLKDRLVVMSSGSAFALVRAQSRVHMFPSEPGGISADVIVGDGQRPVESYRRTVTADDAILLAGGSWLTHVPIKTLASVVAYADAENCGDAADELYMQSGSAPLPGLLIVFGEAPRPQRPGGPPFGGPPTRPQRPLRSRFGGLPTALGAAPPVRPALSGPPSTVGPPVAERTVGFDEPAEALPTLAVPPAQAVPQSFDYQEFEAAGEDELSTEELSTAEPQDEPIERTPGGSRIESLTRVPGQIVAGASSGLRQARGLLARMLPDSPQVGEGAAPGVASPEPSLQTRELDAAVRVAGRAQPETAQPTASVNQPPPITVEPFTPPPPAQGARARMFILLAVAILALVPIVVLAVYWGEGADRRAEAEQLTMAAEALLGPARDALDLGDKAAARQKLAEAESYLIKATELDGATEHRTQLAATIRAELQEVLQIVLLYGLTEPLISFPQEAQARRVIVVDEEIFVLDAGRQQVLHFRFDPAVGLVTDPQGQVVLSAGDVVDGVTVGQLISMAWLPLIPGAAERSSLLILDAENHVFRYDQRVEGAAYLALEGQSTWRSVNQIQTYLGRIYLADETVGEIYRYDPSRPADPPDMWMNPQAQAQLENIAALQIDGDIWVLFEEGTIVRYSQGDQVPFSLETGVGDADQATDMYVTSQDGTLIYVVDGGQDRILVFDKSGAYRFQLRAPEGDLLRNVSGIYVDEVGGSMYILTPSALFKHPIAQQ